MWSFRALHPGVDGDGIAKETGSGNRLGSEFCCMVFAAGQLKGSISSIAIDVLYF